MTFQCNEEGLVSVRAADPSTGRQIKTTLAEDETYDRDAFETDRLLVESVTVNS